MTIFLFLFYFILFLFVINGIAQKKQTGIGFKALTAAFSFKVLLGCLYGYVFLHFYGGDDTWWFFKDSLGEYQKMIHQPGQFLRDFSPAEDYYQAASLGEFVKHYLYDVEFFAMRKLLAVFNFFSQGNYYIDALFFDFFTFWGAVFLYRLMIVRFPSKKNLLLLLCFFIPSTGFWLSGIRAEGIVFLFLLLIIYYSVKWINSRRILDALWIVAGLLGMIVFRAVFLLVFIPAWISLMCSYLSKRNPLRVFAGVYLLSLILFFASPIVSENLSCPEGMVMAQQKFFSLHAKTVLKLDSLRPDLISFVRLTPQAISHVFFRPFLWEAKGILQILSALDAMAFWVLLILFLTRLAANLRLLLQDPLLLLFLFYGFTLTVLIGFIVPFPGAIVRYKSIPELLLIVGLASTIHTKKFIKL
jgi:hypothetical protein